jgi:hypothetical protein
MNMATKNMQKSNELKAARSVVKHLEAALVTAKNQLPVEGHDDREALLTTLERALSAARNVLRGLDGTK